MLGASGTREQSRRNIDVMAMRPKLRK